MTRAADIAKTAYEQALAAAEAEAARREAKIEAARQQRLAERQAEFDAALPILNEWFPGVEWTWKQMGDYGHDTIITDAAETWPPSFKLKVEKFKGEPVKIMIGDYVQDTSLPGYSYFSGGEVKSAADVGRYLAGRIKS